MARRVAIVGVGQTKHATIRKDVNTPELAAEAVLRALEDAKIDIKDIDAIVWGSAPDAFEGVVAPHCWCADAIGAIGKPSFRIGVSGITGGQIAYASYYLVASGLYDIVLGVGLQKVGESPDAQKILNTVIDPIYERIFGAGAIHLAATQATSYMSEFRYDVDELEESLAYIAALARRNAVKNPYAHLHFPEDVLTVENMLSTRYICWPIRLSDCCPRSCGAGAIVVAAEDVANKLTDSPAWIKAAVELAEGYWWGGPRIYDINNWARWLNLMETANKAYKIARIDNPKKEIQVVEIYDAFTIHAAMEIEACRFCDWGESLKLFRKGEFDMNGEPTYNPSGGVLSSNPIGASGLIRVIEAAYQVMGKAEKRQVDNVENALAHAWGGSAQFHTLFILGKSL